LVDQATVVATAVRHETIAAVALDPADGPLDGGCNGAEISIVERTPSPSLDRSGDEQRGGVNTAVVPLAQRERSCPALHAQLVEDLPGSSSAIGRPWACSAASGQDAGARAWSKGASSTW
jgi:hypothetical protein